MPGGFGKRGIDGMLNAIHYAREHKVPYFGICLGMQTMVIEFARNVCGLEHANSTEFDPGTPHRVIFKLRELKGVDELGGTMRLGSWPCQLAEGSFAHEAYGAREINERHRHRYEFNREYEDRLKAAGLRITGETPDGTYVEICEIADHPVVSWAASSIPSSSRKPLEPHPLFKAFIGAARAAARPAPVARSRSRVQPSSRVPIEFARFRHGALVLIAGPCVIESEEHVHRMARGHPRSGGRVRLQGLLRQGQPHQRRTRIAARDCSEGLRILAGVKAEGFPILTDIHEPCAGRAGGGGRRHSADPRVPLPPDRSAARGRAHGHASSTSRRASSSRRTISTTPRRRWRPPAIARWC